MNPQNQFGQIIGRAVEDWTPREMPPLKKMQGRYCVLEPLVIDAHGPKLFEALNFNTQGETWTYLPFGPFETYTEFNQWLDESSSEKIYFVVIDCKDNLPKGLISYHNIDLQHGVIEIGGIHYSMLLQTRAATEAVFLMLCRAFDELQYRRCQWRCNSLNEASCKAAERFGFTFEGIFRQSNVFKNQNRDNAWYSIIDSEWPAIKEKFQRWLEPSNFDEYGKQVRTLQSL